MIKETFRYIEYSNEKRFNKTKEGTIELKQFTDDLLFSVNFDSTFNAIYASGSFEPQVITGSPTIANFDVFGFGQHGELNGSVVYGEESFQALTTEGSIKFFLRSSFNNAVGEQWFKNQNPVTTPINQNYGFTIYTNNDSQEFSISVVSTDTGLDIFNKLAAVLVGNGYQVFRVNNLIRVTTVNYGDEIFITDPTTEGLASLVTLMGGVNKPMLLNGPSSNIQFLKLAPASGHNNEINLTHTTTSHILLQMYDNAGTLVVDEDLGIWSNNRNEYYAFELNWNEQIGQLFIGGELNKVFMTGVTRSDCNTLLTLYGASPNYHLIDELQVYDTAQHLKNYAIETAPLTPYDASRPYIDINFGQGYKETEIKDILIDGTTGLNFVVKIGVNWYYYYGGSWRSSDGSFSQSNDTATIEAMFADLFFNDKFDLVIRVFFNSDGWTPVFISEISIIKEVGTESGAFITGEIRLGGTVDLSSNNTILITTDQGSREVTLTTSAIDTSAVTLEEIKQAIRDAAVPGLASVSDDGNSKLVLIASTQGADSYISVSDASTASALDLVWGAETSDTGEDDEVLSGVFIDYSEIFRWVRSKLGAPLVPVELTDTQLEDCLSESIYHYNRWRNYKENVIYTNLHGDAKNGWEVPAIVGGDENILEVILEPRYPMNYYAGRDDLMSNIFLQQIFNTRSIMASAADYHITLTAQRDLGIILNTEIRWEIINRRLFITPHPGNSLRAAIKYKSSLTLDEIVTSQPIRDLTLAIAKITLGTIRSTFGNQVPGGDGMLQLNGSELKTEGASEKEALLEEWKKSTNVYEFILG